MTKGVGPLFPQPVQPAGFSTWWESATPAGWGPRHCLH